MGWELPEIRVSGSENRKVSVIFDDDFSNCDGNIVDTYKTEKNHQIWPKWWRILVVQFEIGHNPFLGLVAVRFPSTIRPIINFWIGRWYQYNGYI